MALEERMAKIEGGFEQMNKRFDDMSFNMNKRMDRIENGLDNLSGKIDSQFKWTIGIWMTMWVTIILAIILKG